MAFGEPAQKIIDSVVSQVREVCTVERVREIFNKAALAEKKRALESSSPIKPFTLPAECRRPWVGKNILAGVAKKEARKEMRESIKKWYKAAFPDDDLAEEMNGRKTFAGLWRLLLAGGGADFYDFVGVADSVIRERVFSEIAQREGVGYEVIYQLWIQSEDMYGQRPTARRWRGYILPKILAAK